MVADLAELLTLTKENFRLQLGPPFMLLCFSQRLLHPFGNPVGLPCIRRGHDEYVRDLGRPTIHYQRHILTGL